MEVLERTTEIAALLGLFLKTIFFPLLVSLDLRAERPIYFSSWFSIVVIDVQALRGQSPSAEGECLRYGAGCNAQPSFLLR